MIDKYTSINGSSIHPDMSTGADFGAAVATIGDWDNNGVNDLIVSAPG